MKNIGILVNFFSARIKKNLKFSAFRGWFKNFYKKVFLTLKYLFSKSMIFIPLFEDHPVISGLIYIFSTFSLFWLKTTSNKLSKSYFRFSVPKLVPELQALKLAHWLIFEKPRFFREAQKFFYGCRFWPQWNLFDVSHRIMGAGGTTLFERAALGGGGGQGGIRLPHFFPGIDAGYMPCKACMLNKNA